MKKALFSPLRISLCTLGYLCSLWVTGSNVKAQVTTDNTVNTIVTPNENVAEITGGETRGNNLFHSFQEFSVGTGNEASFLNADSISNIFSRVTGGNISNIDGLIRANDANLFLINPAGILFGAGGRLDLGGGSFFGSSASSILFEDGEFSAADLENSPLLTVNAPIGLSFRNNPADIRVNGNSNTGIVDNLTVNPGQNFTLVGGNISFDAGVVIAPGGRIELGGLSESGIVSLNEDFSFSFPDNVARADIDFTNGASINVASAEGGSININARNLNLTTGSRIIGGLVATGVTIPDAEAGDISINATETITLDGIDTVSRPNSTIENNVESGAIGNAGDINISSQNLSLSNGGQIQTTVRQDNPSEGLSAGEGSAGDININAEEAVTVSGVSVVFEVNATSPGDLAVFPNTFSSLISSSLDVGATGESGDISITSDSLSLSDGSQIFSSTFGQGNAGNITLDITSDLNLDGVNRTVNEEIFSPSGSAIFSTVESGAVGNGGVIDIQAQNLSLSNGGQIQTIVREGNSQFELPPGNGSAGAINIQIDQAVTISGVSEVLDINGLDSSFPSLISSSLDVGATGESGDISITSDSLSLTDGGQIFSSTLGQGNAGNITLNIAKDLNIDGANQVVDEGISVVQSSGILSSVKLGAEGNGGDITVTAGSILLTDSGLFNAESLGEGNAGQLAIKADSLSLDTNAKIDASTTFGQGGIIDLQITGDIILKNNSTISARALENADGGNLNIDARFIIAFPNQIDGNGSDIIANAENGNGGNIAIGAESLFGIDEGDAIDNNQTNDIDVSSEFGLAGTISIFTPDTNSIQAGTELPDNLVEPKQTTAQACAAGRASIAQNSLTFKGKGGVPPIPDSPLDSQNISINGKYTNSTSAIPEPVETSQGKIQPARGIKVTEDRNIILTAYRTNNAGDRILEDSINCNGV